MIASEKKVTSVLVDDESMEKIKLFSSNVGVAYSGMGPDFRVLARRGRKEAQKYFLQYKDIVPVSQLVREVASVMQVFPMIDLLLQSCGRNLPSLGECGRLGCLCCWQAMTMMAHNSIKSPLPICIV